MDTEFIPLDSSPAEQGKELDESDEVWTWPPILNRNNQAGMKTAGDRKKPQPLRTRIPKQVLIFLSHSEFVYQRYQCDEWSS